MSPFACLRAGRLVSHCRVAVEDVSSSIQNNTYLGRMCIKSQRLKPEEVMLPPCSGYNILKCSMERLYARLFWSLWYLCLAKRSLIRLLCPWKITRHRKMMEKRLYRKPNSRRHNSMCFQCQKVISDTRTGVKENCRRSAHL